MTFGAVAQEGLALGSSAGADAVCARRKAPHACGERHTVLTLLHASTDNPLRVLSRSAALAVVDQMHCMSLALQTAE